MKVFFRLACVATMMAVVGCSVAENDTISVITREEGSGTRGAFVEIVGILEDDVDNTTLDAIVHDGTGKVMTAVANDKNAIGYISLGSLNGTVSGLSIDGVAPTIENVQTGKYKIARPFNIVYQDDRSALAEDFINFIISENGQKIVNENSFIGIYENDAFTSTLQSGTIVIGGSTSVYPLMEKLAEAYKTINTNAIINIEAIGSSAGVKGAIDGTFDIGMASRNLKDSEKASILHMPIAQDGIVVIANEENPLSDLSLEDVKGIYTAEIINFSDIK